MFCIFQCLERQAERVLRLWPQHSDTLVTDGFDALWVQKHHLTEMHSAHPSPMVNWSVFWQGVFSIWYWAQKFSTMIVSHWRSNVLCPCSFCILSRCILHFVKVSFVFCILYFVLWVLHTEIPPNANPSTMVRSSDGKVQCNFVFWKCISKLWSAYVYFVHVYSVISILGAA